MRARSIGRISVLRVPDHAAGGWRRRLTALKATCRFVTSAVRGSLDLPAPLALLGMPLLFSPSFPPLLFLPVAARLEHANSPHCSHTVPSHSPALWRGTGTDGPGVVAGGTSANAVGRTGPAPGGAASSADDGSAKAANLNVVGLRVPALVAAASCAPSCDTSGVILGF